MAATTRQVSSTIPQGVDEAITYELNFTRLVDAHGAIQAVDCTLYNHKKGVFENELLSGTATWNGAVVKAQAVSGLTARTLYRLSVACEFEDGNVLSATLGIMGEI